MSSNEITFRDLYSLQLAIAINERPSDYGYGPDMAFSVATKMTDALRRGSANKEGLAIKRTCKLLGIKYTYAAIKDYLNEMA